MDQMKELNHLKIPLQAIKNCTQDFNETNFIGKGGYGRVYKGILIWKDYQNLPVAVKQLDLTGFQGSKEFNTEILMLSQYRHKNIVTLIGFCDDGDEMILVYEYASHGSLDAYLSDPAMLGQLSWEKRLHICVGAAAALEYLHNHVSTNHRIIHRDIKSANILLDENWNAKLSDFGLSKISLANQQNTFVVTNLAGTHGYCDPQYERTGILTKESDVYSFGVVLFEVLCGRLACVLQYSDERRFLHHFARTCYENGEVDKIIDHRIRKHIMAEPLKMFSAIAYQCLHKTREERPTIAEVGLALENVARLQGEIVRLLAYERRKIRCDPEMQQEIDKYMSVGQASFSVLLLMDSPDNWEQTTLSLTRSGYEIKVNRTQDIFIHEEYSNDLSVRKNARYFGAHHENVPKQDWSESENMNMGSRTCFAMIT
ncbi:hypothetical protein OSB04_013182 [Centaurea solstitialis]|uniref:Protein kinase domain-containing protein n=1 Tax=Centaurea solstitialis TaxID=347529 RepID=A0AA38TCS2_9ASTR|nr:hypothetical protein OSB04_013182 [Centaurea solstitialis]